MADEEKTEASEKEEGGGSSKSPLLLVIISAVVSALIGGGGSYFLVMWQIAASEDAAAEEAAAAEAVEEEVDAAADFRERLLSLEPFVVNVMGEGRPRYLKLKLDLEAESLETKSEVEARLPQLRDSVILLLSSKRLADINNFEGKALLKDDIRERVNGILEKGQVRSVLFTEFVVQ